MQPNKSDKLMTDSHSSKMLFATSVEDAISTLAELGSQAILIAGGTWVMRAPIRREAFDQTLVSLTRIEDLYDVKVTSHSVSIGCLVTHDALVRVIKAEPDLQGLTQAAQKAANPAIRRIATVVGNLCTSDFHASDIVPALLSLGALVETQSASGVAQQAVDKYIASRNNRDAVEIVTKIIVPRNTSISAHERLTLRKAGDYPTANLSIVLKLNDMDRIETVRIAVGAVEIAAKRWSRLEAAVLGDSIETIEIGSLAKANINEFKGRDGVDAPAWYRLRVLPSLATRAIDNLKLQLAAEKKN
jgi:aerobic carbon-monoxide dehydrogenase medium subunit